ncbi:hypothetical protein OSTOST_23738 [Ostertagia ostertagi]
MLVTGSSLPSDTLTSSTVCWPRTPSPAGLSPRRTKPGTKSPVLLSPGREHSMEVIIIATKRRQTRLLTAR